MQLLTAQNVSYKYPGSSHCVLHDASLTVRPGEVVRITGRNGSGKTTLLKLLSGIIAPVEGTVTGHQQATYMDQTAGDMLASGLTVLEQLRLTSQSRANSLSELQHFHLGLTERFNEFIGHLSGGQRQIIALLCTLNSGAPFLCLDEFTSALDSQSAQAATSILAEALRTHRLGVVYVSHSREWLVATETCLIDGLAGEDQ